MLLTQKILEQTWKALSALGFMLSLLLINNPSNATFHSWPQSGIYSNHPGLNYSMQQQQMYSQIQMFSPIIGSPSGYQVGQWPYRRPSYRQQNPFNDPMFQASLRSQWNATIPMGSSYRPAVGSRAIYNRAYWDAGTRSLMGF